ncbi:FadR family transcriptional regulator [Verminephrobacter aporrectodeae subsp. tuberculatae]|uniref:FadR family transcriptional regulator n=1 Tax=Verminephrobacter aporrectodeae subsp. tuberculatae TaxID=1110392 RepID=A0ABT3KXQ4_9BURK|nr:FadR/GntR family transcriptional regulator [Verminephrobacter aporrectodeae]MCW5220977.1 FadR family transcriptional regulator [Verminephrobacter aporrectodeae subsp. tuberculatae]MCW5258632.1 FadR family transcriptional regulator [Verminephrobacter aporrectodeae subsp. tuberculatae]MCW5290270.1 FadR family transcriptional regulator [Verminephrobacter aporrectodeae subsp. tuberculatae]MCW5323080.1 FadR family transcriptional regulator [Verminephrobacter aporrectodeae subsp. tuberculatae]MCW
MNTPNSNLGYRRPPERKSMHARIVRDLGMRIVSGEYKPGTRLPAEASLCTAYDVSRPVLREATRVLVAKGLVVPKQKAGAIVCARSDWHLLDPDVLYWLIQTKPQPEFVETLLTVRHVFEPAVAALAAKVATPEALHGIAQAYADMESARTPEELLEPDLAFHRRIAEATGNDLLAYIGNMLSLALRESIKLSNQHPDAHALSLPRHKAILTALLNRDSLAARQATFVQLDETREDIAHLIDFGFSNTNRTP